MRNVEEKIIQTLRGWPGEGSKVLSCRDRVEVEASKKYFLWENLIFWTDAENYYNFCACGYATSTTKSRLKSILGSFCGANIYQKNYSWFLTWNSKKYPIDSNNIFCFKGDKLYKKLPHDEEVLPL